MKSGNTPRCKTHPDAPHGFDRNASHNADRYVCECEGWEPYEEKRPAGGVVADIPNNTRSGGQPVRWNAPVGDPALISKLI
jgi:hypothetical protein